MIKPNIVRITPIAVAIIAFIMGDPGALIHRARFGLRKVPIPSKTTIAPDMRSIVFTNSMVSTSVLLPFHTQAFLRHHP